jgi:AcrR family transcriptional regulator
MQKNPKPLSRERIVEAALTLIADDSLAGFSTRKLGERLGCQAMSIYHHFPSKQHLLDALVDHAMACIDTEPPQSEPLERLRHMVRSYRAMANRFPALYPLLAVHRLNTPTGVSTLERVIALVHEVVPDAELAARHFRTLGYYITGAALDETSGYARGPSAAEPVSDAYVAEHCPHLMASAPFFQARHWQATYELGLDALLARVAADGETVRRRIAAGSRRRARKTPA